jgi:hypothetical protein
MGESPGVVPTLGYIGEDPCGAVDLSPCVADAPETMRRMRSTSMPTALSSAHGTAFAYAFDPAMSALPIGRRPVG